jgi:hypothetical protein
VLPAYVGPFDDPANSDYIVEICRTRSLTGPCLGGYASSVDYPATKDAVATFAVRVKAPAVRTAFAPDKRRVYVNFALTDAPYLRIAAPNVAVRRQ